MTISNVANGASYEFGNVPVARCNVTDKEDGNSSFDANLSAITGARAAEGLGSQTASCNYDDAVRSQRQGVGDLQHRRHQQAAGHHRRPRTH